MFFFVEKFWINDTLFKFCTLPFFLLFLNSFLQSKYYKNYLYFCFSYKNFEVFPKVLYKNVQWSLVDIRCVHQSFFFVFFVFLSPLFFVAFFCTIFIYMSKNGLNFNLEYFMPKRVSFVFFYIFLQFLCPKDCFFCETVNKISLSKIFA